MQELAECLADPLVPKFSHRFFTGGAAAAVGAQQAADAPAALDNSDATTSNQAPVVKQAVNYANKVQDNRKAAAAQQAAKKQKQKGQLQIAAAVLKRPVKVTRQMAEDQALQAALNRSQVKKDLRQRNSKLMVIPAAFGREQRGADALQALRAKMHVRPPIAK